MQAEHLIYKVDTRGVAYLTLNRPEKHNAFDDAMIAELREHFDAVASDGNVRALVLQAAGKSFSAGGDLAWMQRMADFGYEDNLQDARALAMMLNALKTLPQPSIARVQGNAFGGAVGLISCCDIAVAADVASFGLTEARIGLIPATIAPHVVEAIGARWARRLFMTAERFDVELAERVGLVHEACDSTSLDEIVENQLRALLRNSPQAIQQAKILVRDVLGEELNDALIDETSSRIARIRVSEEGQEGLQAFLEKRAPAWLAEETH